MQVTDPFSDIKWLNERQWGYLSRKWLIQYHLNINDFGVAKNPNIVLQSTPDFRYIGDKIVRRTFYGEIFYTLKESSHI